MATFTVTDKGLPTPTHAWYIGDEVDPDDRTPLSNNATYSGVSTKTLTVSNVLANMHGNKYSCKIVNAKGTTWTRLCNLSVFYKAIITTQPVSQNLVEGQPYQLSILVTQGNPTATFQWYRNAVLVPNGGRFSGMTTKTMNVTDYDVADAGSWTCRATNAAGVATSNAAVLTTATGYPADCPIGQNYFYDACATRNETDWSWSDTSAEVGSDGQQYCITQDTYSNAEFFNSTLTTTTGTEISAQINMDIDFTADAEVSGAGAYNTLIFVSGVNHDIGLTSYADYVGGAYRIYVAVRVYDSGTPVYSDIIYDLDLTGAVPFSTRLSRVIRITADGVNMKFYFNNVEVYSIATATMIYNVVGKVACEQYPGEWTMRGGIDNIRVVSPDLATPCDGGPETASYWTAVYGMTFP
jgi:hypothetical protein